MNQPEVSAAARVGSLVCVGTGMSLGAHLTPRARHCIETADVVLTALSDPLVELWVRNMNRNVLGLQDLYQEGKPRHTTYRQMVERILGHVREGKRVCVAFYGHPGVFAQAAHQAIAEATQEGYSAHMEPGISAADCLYSDLGVDPGRLGCQHFEATQFLLYDRAFDRSAYLVLWQIGVFGDLSHSRFASRQACLELLTDELSRHYSRDHQVIVYEAATSPLVSPRIERVALQRLPDLQIGLGTTLVIPPSEPLRANPGMRERLQAIQLLDPS